MLKELDELIKRVKSFAERLPTQTAEADASMAHMYLIHLRRQLCETLPND